MGKKGVAPKVTLLQQPAKVTPIPRGVDNTDAINDELQRVHAKNSHIQAPNGTRGKSATKGAFDPTDNKAFNGNQVVVPPS